MNGRAWTSEEQYKTILDQSPVMIAYLDQDLTFRFVNETYCELRQLSASQIVGNRAAEILPSPVQKMVQSRLEAALAGYEQRFESKYFYPEGDERWVETYYIPDRKNDGTVQGLFAFIHDIHDRKVLEDSRARFKHAVDQGCEGFALHDVTGNFAYVNPAQAAMYGYDPAEVLGESWKLFYDAEEVERIETDCFPQLFKEGRWRGELIGRKKSGETIDVDVSLTLLVDEAGEPTGLVCNCQDITQRKIAEESLRQLQKMDAVGQLTGGIAHDFNNLLAIIMGSLDLICDSTRDQPELYRHAERAIRAASRGATLTHRLLAFSRKQPLQPRAIDLNDLVADMNELLQRSLGEQIEVKIEGEDPIWPCEVDPSQLENAILNLALNARDAMLVGGTLTIKTRNVAHDEAPLGDGMRGECILLSISDTGEGMPEDVLQRIFEPFFTTKEVGKGSGLGLSMVHGFVTQSGGEVDVSSAPGLGTTINILLPRSKVGHTAGQSASDLDVPSQGHAETILVVEDDLDVREITVTMLESLGFSVVEATDGVEALQKLEALGTVDLLLCDVVLPGGYSGPDIERLARDSHPSLKVIFMSGYSDKTPDLDSNVELIPKPFTRSVLEAKIRDVLGSHVSETARSVGS